MSDANLRKALRKVLFDSASVNLPKAVTDEELVGEIRKIMPTERWLCEATRLAVRPQCRIYLHRRSYLSCMRPSREGITTTRSREMATAEDEKIARITIGAWLDTLEYGRFPAGKLTELINRIASALAAEREKAVEVLEDKATVWDKEFNDLRSQRKRDNQSRNVKALAARQCAAAIRERDKE